MSKNENFKLWRDKLSDKKRKNIKKSIDIFIVCMFILGAFFVHNLGITKGKIELCDSQEGILVEHQGVTECMTDDEYSFIMDQFNTSKKIAEGMANELQYYDS